MPEEPKNGLVYVPIPATLYAEFILRSGTYVDVGPWIAEIVDGYLDRTYGDARIWSQKHADEATEEDEAAQELRRLNGDPSQGYQWQTVFLPNGSKLRMLYRAQNHYATVQHEQLRYDGVAMTPSEFASKVAGGTNRNAWRDLYIQFPGAAGWEHADVVRKQPAGGRSR